MNPIIISDSAIERIREIKEKKENHQKFLRISVLGGGCSGFQYVFELDNKKSADDVIIKEEESQILAITDETSLPFLDGAKVEFVKELGASYFKVNNPNAKASCGCGSSFSV